MSEKMHDNHLKEFIACVRKVMDTPVVDDDFPEALHHMDSYSNRHGSEMTGDAKNLLDLVATWRGSRIGTDAWVKAADRVNVFLLAHK